MVVVEMALSWAVVRPWTWVEESWPSSVVDRLPSVVAERPPIWVAVRPPTWVLFRDQAP